MPRPFQFSLKTLMALVAASAVGCLVLPPIYGFFDGLFRGPYTVYFNERCERIVRSRGLIGKSPEAVRDALGEPTSIYVYEEEGSFTFNYAPFFWSEQFQAHFTNGRLSSTELFDL